jgi:hypothetical protein
MVGSFAPAISTSLASQTRELRLSFSGYMEGHTISDVSPQILTPYLDLSKNSGPSAYVLLFSATLRDFTMPHGPISGSSEFDV